MQALQQEVSAKTETKASMAGTTAEFKDPKSIVKSAMNELGVKNVFQLEMKLKKDKQFRENFMNNVRGKIEKSGLKMDVNAVIKNGIRELKVEEYRTGIKAKLVGIEKAEMVSTKKLIDLFDSVASQMGETNAIKFYHKYNTDPKFREAANVTLMNEIRSDPELRQLLGNEKPEDIMHGLTQLKGSFMSKTDYIKFVATETFKRLPVEFAKQGATVVGGTIATMMMAPMHVVMNAMPGMSGASYMTMDTLKQTTDVFNKISQAIGSIKTSTTPQSMILGQYSPENPRNVGEEASKNQPASA